MATKNNRKTKRVNKTPSWYKKEIERIDRRIDKIRADRFGYPRRG